MINEDYLAQKYNEYNSNADMTDIRAIKEN